MVLNSIRGRSHDCCSGIAGRHGGYKTDRGHRDRNELTR